MSLWSFFGVASMDLNCFNVSVVRCSRNSRCSVLSCFLSFRIASFDIFQGGPSGLCGTWYGWK